MSSIVSSLIRQARDQKAADCERWQREAWRRREVEAQARMVCRRELTPVVKPFPEWLAHMNSMSVAAVMCMLEAFAPWLIGHQPSTIAEIDAFCEGVDMTRITWAEVCTHAADEAARIESLFRQRLPQLWAACELLGVDPNKDNP